MSDRTFRNATIQSVELGNRDHRCLTLWVMLEWDGGGQGFGGNVLDEPDKDSQGNFIGRKGTAFGCQYIIELLNTLCAENLDKLKGMVVRIDHEHNKVHGIGHAIKDKWFYPEKLRIKYYG